MLAVERRNQIERLINENGSVLVTELANKFGVTTETIRNDLERLEKKGILRRAYGGATLADESDPEPTVNERTTINYTGKEAIGRKAAELVSDGETIFIDASTSSLHMARYIRTRQSLTVITNAEKVVEELSSCEHITVICIGGKLKARNMSFVGHITEDIIRKNYNANKVFFSCKGLSEERGLTEQSDGEAEVKRAMIDMSEECIFLCDCKKFDTFGLNTIVRLDKVDAVITDEEPSDVWKTKFANDGVRVIVAE